MRTNGNSVFITGGGSGIGLSLAKVFAQHDNQVIICGRNAQKLETANSLDPRIRAVVCDVSRPSDIQRMLAEHRAAFNEVNILVNNAGVMNVYDWQSDPAALDLMEAEFATNFRAPLYLTKWLLPTLATKREAAIVNISSGAALVPMPATPTYSATKAALHSFTKALRYQMRNSPVKIFEVMPPVVDTDMPAKLNGSGKTMKKKSPDAVAAEVLAGLSKDRFEMRLGDVALMYWANRFMPSVVEKQLNRL